MNGHPPTAIIGAGAFGTALACAIAADGRAPVILFARDPAQAEAIRRTGRNEKALPGIDLPPMRVTCDMTDAAGAARILLSVPSQAQGAVAKRLSGMLPDEAEFIICAKGMERSSRLFLSAVVEKAALRHPVSVLSGPGFANDIARGLPTAMTIANKDMARARASAAALSGSGFRLYSSTDVAGVEIGGALKNVLAIACGIVDGAGLGLSARAALISRGLAEMSRFAIAHGGKGKTISGLSGLGDLVLTATSDQSRNFRYGAALGRGGEPADIDTPGAPLCEGAFTAGVAAAIAAQRDIDMPIIRAVADIIDGRMTIGEAIETLMNRPLRAETHPGDGR